MGTWLEILHRQRLSRVPVFQTKESFNISHHLLLATLETALKGKILKMENRAVQFRCPTATRGLGRPTNDLPGHGHQLMTVSLNCRTGFEYLCINHSGC